jgi:hypothetical protein
MRGIMTEEADLRGKYADACGADQLEPGVPEQAQDDPDRGQGRESGAGDRPVVRVRATHEPGSTNRLREIGVLARVLAHAPLGRGWPTRGSGGRH